MKGIREGPRERSARPLKGLSEAAFNSKPATRIGAYGFRAIVSCAI